jgi:hypothetical protein
VEVVQPRDLQVVYGSFQPVSGLDDAALQAVLEAKKEGKIPPSYGLFNALRTRSTPVTFHLTSGPSIAFTTSATEKAYLRRSGDHFIMITAAGKSPDDYTLEPFKIAVLH